METGLKYVMTGVVQRKYQFDDQKTGQTVRGVEVAWMGGSCSFLCDTADEQENFPNDGEPVTIQGILMLSKAGLARFKLGEISVPKAARPATSAK